MRGESPSPQPPPRKRGAREKRASIHVIARSESDEAIHSSFAWRDGLLRRCAPRNDDWMCVRILAARSRPRFAKLLPLRKQRAQGRPGARCTRGLACTMHKANAHEHTGSAETLRPSLRNGFTAYNGLSPVTGLFCHRRSREAIASQELDASVGASGPHDFAVRIGALVSRAAASIASRLAFRDDCAYAPPVRRDGASW